MYVYQIPDIRKELENFEEVYVTFCGKSDQPLLNAVSKRS